MDNFNVWIKAGFGFRANLQDSDLRDANLRDANLRSANLLGADLQDSDLRDANLRSADLLGANLLGADLQDADLRDANLRSADLLGANLRRANLQYADLHGANLDMSSGIPFWCGGTNIRIDFNLSIQAIYHVFNQQHESEEIKTALEPLRSLAEKFRERRTDAPKLRD